MKKIVYISFASNEFKESDIQDILNIAHNFNPSVGITGMLLYKSGTFLQLLEGPKENVEELFQKIEKDSRHKKVYIICDTELTDRIFDNWSMAYSVMEDMDLETINTVLELGQFKDIDKRPVQDNRYIMQIIERFRAQLPDEDAEKVS